MILFYLLAAYCIIKCVASTGNNIKAAYMVINHFETPDTKPYHIYIEGLTSALVDSIAIFIAGSIIIYALICIAEEFHIEGLL